MSAYTKADFDGWPDDDSSTVGVGFEVFNREYSDDLNNCHEEPCSKHSHEDQLDKEAIVRIKSV